MPKAPSSPAPIPMDRSDGAILEARRRPAEPPGEFFYPDQRKQRRKTDAPICEGAGREVVERTGGRAPLVFRGRVGNERYVHWESRRLRELAEKYLTQRFWEADDE